MSWPEVNAENSHLAKDGEVSVVCSAQMGHTYHTLSPQRSGVTEDEGKYDKSQRSESTEVK